MDVLTQAMLSEFVAGKEIAALPESEQFEHFAAFSVISARYKEDFSTEDVVVGGGNDLGIDACAIIVNSRLITEQQEISDIIKHVGYLEAEFIFVQAKRSSEFDSAKIIALFQNLKCTVFGQDRTPPHNDDVKSLLSLIDRIYHEGAKLRANPECRIYYVTTGTWQEPEHIVSTVKFQTSQLQGTNLFQSVKFIPFGAPQLQKAYRDTKYSIESCVNFERNIVLPKISNVQASYLGFLPAAEFLKLIVDSEGDLLQSVFIDNIRDFQGNNNVNLDIASTIQSENVDQFVLRNNGITIVARDLVITGQNFTVRDYQIVNGCQTSHVIYNHRESLDNSNAKLFVPIKVIHTNDEDVIQDVIKSTNQHTPIDLSNLLAFTKFQRDLETYYSGFEGQSCLHYERRSKQYARTDLDKRKIISVSAQLKAFVSMFLGSPHIAGRYQETLLKSLGNKVFNTEHKLQPYHTSAFALYRFSELFKKGYADSFDLRAFKFHFLAAFRYRYESSALPSLSHKDIIPYCQLLTEKLATYESSQVIFEECVSIVRLCSISTKILLTRGNTKSKELANEIQVESFRRKRAG